MRSLSKNKRTDLTDQEWTEYVQDGLNNAAMGIIEAGKRMYQFRQECSACEGGSEFTKEAFNRFGLSKNQAGRWSAIGHRYQALSHSVGNLPNSMSSVAELCRLGEDDIKKALDSGDIHSESTRFDVEQYVKRIKAPPKPTPKPEPKQEPKEDPWRLNEKGQRPDAVNTKTGERYFFDKNKLSEEELKRQNRRNEKVKDDTYGEVNVNLNKLTIKDALAVGGIDVDAEVFDKDVIKSMFKVMKHKLHPDRDTGNEEKFKALAKAEQLLLEKSV